MLKNRLSEKCGEGSGPSCHTGGSRTLLEHARQLAKELGWPPHPHELLKKTHIKANDEFVDLKSKSTYDAVVSKITSASQPIDDSHEAPTVDYSQIYLDKVGGVKKACIYGLGSQAIFYENIGWSSASTSRLQDHDFNTPVKECVQEMKVEMKREMREEIRQELLEEMRHEMQQEIQEQVDKIFQARLSILVAGQLRIIYIISLYGVFFFFHFLSFQRSHHGRYECPPHNSWSHQVTFEEDLRWKSLCCCSFLLFLIVWFCKCLRLDWCYLFEANLGLKSVLLFVPALF